ASFTASTPTMKSGILPLLERVGRRGQTGTPAPPRPLIAQTRRAMNLRRSSMRLHSFQGIQGLPQMPVGVNHVSGMKCQLCAGKHKKHQSNPLQHNAGADVLIRKKAKDAKSGQQGSLQTCWHHIGRLYLAGSGKQKGASPRRPVPAAVSSQAWGRALQLPKQTL